MVVVAGVGWERFLGFGGGVRVAVRTGALIFAKWTSPLFSLREMAVGRDRRVGVLGEGVYSWRI